MGVAGFSAMALAALLAASSAPSAVVERYAQVSVRSRVIVKVPRLPPRPKPVTWREKKGPRCLPMGSLAGAAVTGRDSIDLVLRGGARVRARLERNCPALDFYQGFYLKPHRDGQICADRDKVHTRAGSQCEIATFRSLVPAR